MALSKEEWDDFINTVANINATIEETRKVLTGEKTIHYLHLFTNKAKEECQAAVMDTIAYVHESSNDDLKIVTPRSLLYVIKDILVNEISLSRKHAYIVPYKEKYFATPKAKFKTDTGLMLAKLTMSYIGYIYMMNQSFPDCVIKTFLIWPSDTWEWSEENQQVKYAYKQAAENRMRSDFPKLQGVAMFVEYTKLGRIISNIEEMPISELNKAKAKSLSGVWNEWFDQQAKKAVIRRGLKIPLAGALKKIESYIDIDNADYDVTSDSKEVAVHTGSRATAAMDNLEREMNGGQPPASLALEDNSNVGIMPIIHIDAETKAAVDVLPMRSEIITNVPHEEITEAAESDIAVHLYSGPLYTSSGVAANIANIGSDDLAAALIIELRDLPYPPSDPEAVITRNILLENNEQIIKFLKVAHRHDLVMDIMQVSITPTQTEGKL